MVAMKGAATPELASVEGAFIVELERYQGPLDLLLHLIRSQDIDIFDIPISHITSQFLAAIEGVAALGLDRAGEFLETAALLVRIKVQMLLPRRAAEDGEWEDPRAELVRRLLEYEHFREAAQRLADAEEERIRLYARGYVPPLPTPDPVDTELHLDWDELWSAVLLLEERVRPPEDYRVVPRAVPIGEKIGLILDLLERQGRVEFAELIAPFGDRLHSAVTFLAALELARRRALAIRQHAHFEPLWLYRAEPQEGPGPDEEQAA
jgi:segregation and condensation protein A